MSSAWLIVGLGNPGSEYEHSRHNAGFDTVDILAARAGASWTLHKGAKAMVTRARLGVGPGGVPGPGAILLKPHTFMNASGAAVAHTANYFSIAPERLVIIHDDLDLEAGVIKVRCGGGEGGHNGLKDISRAVGTRAYLRVKVGIGRPPGRQDPAAFVLARLRPAQRPDWELLMTQAADACTDLVTQGLDATQLKWHTR